MRKIIIAGAALALMCGTALAQNSTKADHKAGMHRAANNHSMGTTTGQASGGMPSGVANDSNSMAGMGSSASGAGAGGGVGSTGSMGN